MMWACSAATGPGHLAVIESTMNSSVCQNTLESDVRPTVKARPKLGHEKVPQKDKRKDAMVQSKSVVGS